MVERKIGEATGAETSGQEKVRVEAEHNIMYIVHSSNFLSRLSWG